MQGLLHRLILLRLALAAALSLVAAADAAPQGSPPSGGEPLNLTCPVTPDEPVDPEIIIDHEGQRIAFCCQRCKRQFEREPQAYLARLRTMAPSAPNAPDGSGGSRPNNPSEHAHSASGTEHVHGDTRGSPSLGGAHDHSSHDHGDAATGVSRVLGWFGNFHPMTVHFPIALFMAAALSELLLLLTGNAFFSGPARFSVAIGGAGAVVAAALGWLFGGFHLSDQDWLMTAHRWTGTATAAWATAVLVLSEVHQRRGTHASALRYRLSLFLGAGLVSVAGFLGGSLVYGLDHYAW